MAYQLKDYKSHGQPIPAAYLRIVGVMILREGAFAQSDDVAIINYEIYYNKDARMQDLPSLEPGQVRLKDATNNAALTSAFKGVQSATERTLSSMNLLYTKAYQCLAVAPETATLLTNATNV